jgi:hypothetical protein
MRIMSKLIFALLFVFYATIYYSLFYPLSKIHLLLSSCREKKQLCAEKAIDSYRVFSKREVGEVFFATDPGGVFSKIYCYVKKYSAWSLMIPLMLFALGGKFRALFSGDIQKDRPDMYTFF